MSEKVKIFFTSCDYSSFDRLEKDMNDWLASGNYKITRCQPVGSSNTYICMFIFYIENDMNFLKNNV